MSDDESFECCICLSVMIDPVTTSCGHDACLRCLESLRRAALVARRPATCPTCRTRLQETPFKVNIRLRRLICRASTATTGTAGAVASAPPAALLARDLPPQQRRELGLAAAKIDPWHSGYTCAQTLATPVVVVGGVLLGLAEGVGRAAVAKFPSPRAFGSFCGFWIVSGCSWVVSGVGIALGAIFVGAAAAVYRLATCIFAGMRTPTPPLHVGDLVSLTSIGARAHRSNHACCLHPSHGATARLVRIMPEAEAAAGDEERFLVESADGRRRWW